jgi:hypothetical protein
MHEGNAWEIVEENVGCDTACKLEHKLWNDNYWNIISSQIDEDLNDV